MLISSVSRYFTSKFFITSQLWSSPFLVHQRLAVPLFNPLQPQSYTIHLLTFIGMHNPQASPLSLLTRSFATSNTSDTTLSAFSTKMAGISNSDLVVIVLTLVAAVVYLFKDSLFAKSNDSLTNGKLHLNGSANGHANGGADANYDSRDIVAKLKATVSFFACVSLRLSG